MHFIVYSNFNREQDIAVIERVVKYLKTKKDVTITLASYRESGFLGHSFLKLSDCVKEADLIIVVGGDGTVLRATSDIANAHLETPILAINRGHVGFLADTEPSDLEFAIDKVIKHDYSLDKRLIFKVTFKDKIFYAINEVIIYKSDITRPIVVEAKYENDKPIAASKGDGVYVCTPTGSTAYSLSCGGPILAPDTNALLLGTICAHTLVSKPIVLADNHIISLNLGKGYTTGVLMIDGEIKSFIYDQSPVTIKRSKFMANFIKVKDIDFYKKLLDKLNRWTTTSDELPYLDENSEGND